MMADVLLEGRMSGMRLAEESEGFREKRIAILAAWMMFLERLKS
ncbi:MAG: hypothetical protein ACE5FY_03815 [Nitrospiria bacterium]